MIKTIFKVLYISLAVVLTIVVFVFNYQSTTITQIKDALNGFVNREEYYNVARMCGGLYDSNPIISIQNDDKFDNRYANKMEGVIEFYNNEIRESKDPEKTINKSTIIEDNKFDMVVYAGTKDVTNTYYNTGDEGNLEKAKYHKYDFTYYIYLFDVDFAISDGSAQIKGKKTKTNNAGIRFYAGEEKFDYYAVIDSDYYHLVGKDESDNPIYKTNYLSKPENLQDMFIYGQRNMFESYDKWGFYDFSISQDSINAVNKELGGNDDNKVITSFSILDRDGKEVENSKVDFSFAFTEEFFQDGNAKIIYDAYETYNNIADKDESTDKEISDAEDAFKVEAQEFDDNMKAGLYPTYFKAFEKDDIVKTSTIVWKSILVGALFIFSATVVFILIFKFAWIKSLVFRKKEGHYVPNKEKARQTAQMHQQMQAKKQNQNNGQRLPRGKQNQAAKPANVGSNDVKEEKPNDIKSEVDEEIKVEEAKLEDNNEALDNNKSEVTAEDNNTEAENTNIEAEDEKIEEVAQDKEEQEKDKE